MGVNYAEGSSRRSSDSGSRSSSSSGHCSGSDEDDSSEEEQVSGPSNKRRRSLRVQRYIFSFLKAMEELCHVPSFYTRTAEAIVITFYGVLTQTQVAAYQLEVAVNTATDLAMQPRAKMMGKKARLTDRVSSGERRGDGCMVSQQVWRNQMCGNYAGGLYDGLWKRPSRKGGSHGCSA